MSVDLYSVISRILRQSPDIEEKGAMARTYCTLVKEHPKALTIEEIAEIADLAEITVKKKGVRELFNAQIIERDLEDGKIVYRLKAIPANRDMAVEGGRKPPRGLEDL